MSVDETDPNGTRKVCRKYSYAQLDGSNGWVNERECGVGKSVKSCCLEARAIRKWWLHDYADKPCARRPNPTKTRVSNKACCALVIAIPKEMVPHVTVPKAAIGCAVAGVAGAYYLCCATEILDFPIEIDIAPPGTRQPKPKNCLCKCLYTEQDGKLNGSHVVGWTTRSACNGLPFTSPKWDHCFCKGDP